RLGVGEAHGRRNEDVVAVRAAQRYLIAGLEVTRVQRRAARVAGVREIDAHLSAARVHTDLVGAALHAHHAAGDTAHFAGGRSVRLLRARGHRDRVRAHFGAAGDRSVLRLDTNAVADFEIADAIGVALIDDRRRGDGSNS